MAACDVMLMSKLAYLNSADEDHLQTWRRTVSAGDEKYVVADLAAGHTIKMKVSVKSHDQLDNALTSDSLDNGSESGADDAGHADDSSDGGDAFQTQWCRLVTGDSAGLGGGYDSYHNTVETTLGPVFPVAEGSVSMEAPTDFQWQRQGRGITDVHEGEVPHTSVNEPGSLSQDFRAPALRLSAAIRPPRVAYVKPEFDFLPSAPVPMPSFAVRSVPPRTSYNNDNNNNLTARSTRRRRRGGQGSLIDVAAKRLDDAQKLNGNGGYARAEEPQGVSVVGNIICGNIPRSTVGVLPKPVARIPLQSTNTLPASAAQKCNFCPFCGVRICAGTQCKTCGTAFNGRKR